MVAGCGSGGEITPVVPPPPAARVNSVSVTPTTASIVTGGNASFTATVDVTGSAATTVSWAVSSSAVTLTTSGNSATVTAVSVPAAPVTITATSTADATKSASATINIAAPPSYALQLSSNVQTITVGRSSSVDVSLASVSGGFNQPVSLSVVGLPSGVTATIQPAAITPGQTARVTLAVAGSAPITTGAGVSFQVRGDATGLSARTANVALSIRGAAQLQLNAADSTLDVGQQVQVSATVLDAASTVLTERSVSFTSSNTSRVTVSTAGVMQGIAAGSAFIVAAVDGIADTLPVSVAAPVASVTFTSPDSQLVQGQSVQTTVIARDASGNVVTGRPVSYRSSAPNVATISASGIVTAGSATGFTTLSATVDGAVGQLPLEVVLRVNRVDIATPQSTTLLVGQNLQLQAAAFDANNQVINGRAQDWVSSDPLVATVTRTTGRVTAVAPGPVTITVTIEGVSDTQALTVFAPVASVQVTATKSFVRVNEAVQLTATPRDANGNAIPGLSATWATNSQTNGRVSVFGVFTGVAAGTTSVTATINGVSGSLNMCTAFSYSVGSGTTSGGSANVCNGGAPFIFSTSATDFYAVTGTVGATSSIAPLGTARGFIWGFAAPAGSTQTVYAVMPAGTWGSEIRGTGSYSIGIAAALARCGHISTAYGVSNLPIPISSTCPTTQPSTLAAGTYYSSYFYLQPLVPGESITVTATSASMVPVIELFDGVGTRLATTISQTGGLQTLTYSATTTTGPVTPYLVVSTRVSGLATGTIGVSITGPNLSF